MPCDAQQSDNNIAFPPRLPPFNVVLLFELPVENKKHPNFEWRGGEGKGFELLCSPDLPHLRICLVPIAGYILNNFFVGF